MEKAMLLSMSEKDNPLLGMHPKGRRSFILIFGKMKCISVKYLNKSTYI
jgi:hypothetical protein